ncbi:MAG TPA: hypothetical protein VHE60_12430 [Pyrinomonadaceae bacterium]|nr:hypothetical protein [Pyrinomonadaceae bacterium]
MVTKNPISVLAELEELKRRSGNGDAKIQRALSFLSKSGFDAEALIRFHESLLFLRAYPPSARVLNQVEKILKSFGQRVSQLRESGEELAPLDEVEVSGIAGTTVTSNFSYEIVRWLVAKYPRQVSIDWNWFEEEDRFGSTMPRFLPLLEEDAMVEANVPYRDWLRAAKGSRNELGWIIKRFESLSISNKAKAELYDSLKLHVIWKFSVRASRTGMKLPARKIFFHWVPLIQRRDVSLIKELASPPIPIERLSRAAGEKILDLARETSAVRYRELHGFTCGDSRRVLKADLGRGTEAFVLGVPPEHRLPLRAYHAALILKNGVPVAYFEGLSIFERLESGFNLYYTFREGETAWLFGRILRLMRQLLGVTVFSIDPYQAGHENEEGIESGAFWFYRKLGFRPVRAELMKLALAEGQKIAASRGYRTPARTLRKLAAGHMLYEIPQTERHANVSEWNQFEVRNVGLAVQQRMARNFGGDAQTIRADSANFIKRVLDLDTRRWREPELRIFENFALVLAMIPDIARWNASEKELAARIILAKAGGDEALYLRLMQKHAPMRTALIGFGS